MSDADQRSRQHDLDDAPVEAAAIGPDARSGPSSTSSGSRMPAAVAGETTSAMSGTAAMPSPPPKPPLEMPKMRTAGMAAR